MNICPIGLVKVNSFSQPKVPLKKGLQSDVFVRSTSFKGNEENQNCTDFIKWAQETDFIKSQLENILNSNECKLGSGFTNTAYKIPNNDNYVLRVRTSALVHALYSSKIEDSEIKDTDSKLDINIGQKVAEITIPSRHVKEGMPDYLATTVEVLKKQHGEPIGVQPPETIVMSECAINGFEDIPCYEAPIRKGKYARTIHKVAQQPIEAYEKLISDFQKAYEAGFKFDHLNSNNLLIDEENNAINLIDMEKYSGQQMDISYADLLYSLTNIEYFPTYTSEYINPVSEEEKTQALQDTVQIIDKFLHAMQNKGAKFDRFSPSLEFYTKFISSMPCVMYCKSFDRVAFWKKAEQMGLV